VARAPSRSFRHSPHPSN